MREVGSISAHSMLVLPATAKINLALDVVARRADGWHDIDSLIVPIDWHDLVGISLEASGVPPATRVTGPAAAGVPAGGENVATRAAALLLDAAGAGRTVSIWIDKRVPHAAGLGGGSADAAAALRATLMLLTAEGVAVDEAAPARVAAAAGGDVPAALTGRPVRVRARGDQLAPLIAPSLDVAVAFIAPSATGAAYAALAGDDFASGERVTRLAEMLAAGRRPDDALLGSGLEPAACRANPGLRTALAAARQAVPDARWHLTGSGGALFAIADSREHAQALAQRMRDAGYLARACHTRVAR
jgi:4-diphosphocytidyl-2-C-methyl-D-erythritol kinase